MQSFTEIGLSEPILTALANERHSTPTPIQAKAIPPVLAGRDLIGIAQTGTGKTAAFALPVLDRIARSNGVKAAPRSCRALILTPTRELANQIEERVRAYGRKLNLKTAVLIGGQSIRMQAKAVAGGVDIMIATPGRLLDHMSTRAVSLESVEVLVLDEADRMLDMGFIKPIREISKHLPAGRQNLFFSATMPDAIASLANSLLTNPVTVSVTPVAQTADRIDQSVVHVSGGQKAAVLADVLAKAEVTRALVFARTKRGADRIVKNLASGGIQSAAIHGNKSQPQRERALHGFRHGRIRVLVATDIAARGIDVPEVSHVVNYDIPVEAESYVHRIGRTARAGAEGIAISLCSADERSQLRSIEKLIRQAIPVVSMMGSPAALPGATAERSWEPLQSRPQQPRQQQPRKDAAEDGQRQKSRTRRRRRSGTGNGAANGAGGGSASIGDAPFMGRPNRSRRPARQGGSAQAQPAS